MTQPRLERRKVTTLLRSGTDPEMTSLTLPPTLDLTNLKMKASQMDVFLTMPLCSSSVFLVRAWLNNCLIQLV